VKKSWPALLLLPICGLALVPGIVVIPHSPPLDPCVGRNAELVIDGPSKRMWLCEAGRPVEELRVGLGRGGLDKRSRDDDRTPLGEYALGAPRRSGRFHIFIPIGYHGDDGIGIHGPVSWIRWLPGGATWFNRTRGCVEVADVATVERVASWVRQGRAKNISLR
jgi:hypothetical protein